MKRGLALFDFDGTITTKDTLFELIKFQKGNIAFYLGMIWLSPILILFKLGVVPNWRTKEIVLSLFFANQTLSSFQQMCDQFISNALPFMIRAEALKKIEQHTKKGDRVIVVSASAYNWVEGWCQSINIELISTRLDSKNGILTGKLESLNCNGEEKVKRIKKHLELTDFSPIYAYGNSSGDKPMLALADHPFYKKF
ncbi:MAG: HAD-IB family hydrolase [Cyclobacteriaceae bacterium]